MGHPTSIPKPAVRPLAGGASLPRGGVPPGAAAGSSGGVGAHRTPGGVVSHHVVPPVVANGGGVPRPAASVLPGAPATTPSSIPHPFAASASSNPPHPSLGLNKRATSIPPLAATAMAPIAGHPSAPPLATATGSLPSLPSLAASPNLASPDGGPPSTSHAPPPPLGSASAASSAGSTRKPVGVSGIPMVSGGMSPVQASEHPPSVAAHPTNVAASATPAAAAGGTLPAPTPPGTLSSGAPAATIVQQGHAPPQPSSIPSTMAGKAPSIAPYPSAAAAGGGVDGGGKIVSGAPVKSESMLPAVVGAPLHGPSDGGSTPMFAGRPMGASPSLPLPVPSAHNILPKGASPMLSTPPQAAASIPSPISIRSRPPYGVQQVPMPRPAPVVGVLPPTSAAPPVMQPPQPTPMVNRAGAAAPPQPIAPQQSPQRSAKYETALDFLEQVKQQFTHKPAVYNQFLEIMKEFKAQNINTPGVIRRVSTLFEGHPLLIEGFNTFLPPGYKIEVPPAAPNPTSSSSAAPSTTASASSSSGGAGGSSSRSTGISSGADSVVAGARKQPGFNHARKYVKKIKYRFSDQPHVYKQFLEILHAFHREQHTIKEVYEQVAKLFKTHSDLLEEFTQFLPDPIPKERASNRTSGRKRSPRRAEQKPPPSKKRRSSRKADADEASSSSSKRHSRGGSAGGSVDRVQVSSFKELNLFYTIKKRLVKQGIYNDFLKCLRLFSDCVIDRLELILLVSDILSGNDDLLDRFKSFVGFDDDDAVDMDDAEPGLSMEDVDYSHLKQYGPSYREIPDRIAAARAAQNKPGLATEVLNDRYVSHPTGREDFGFTGHRKNQYEEVLFKCEDDRYELDLVIELNASAIKALEPILKKMKDLYETGGATEVANYKIFTPIDVLHIRSIERIYGDKGPEVIEGLFMNPAVAVPAIMKRLRQKDQEWRAARREWNKIWREVNEKNYHRSLDHQSFYFKQLDKKKRSHKVMLAEIKQKHQELTRQSKESGGSPEGGAQLKYTFDDKDVMKNILDLIKYAAPKVLSKGDRTKFHTLLNAFVSRFFNIPHDASEEANGEGESVVDEGGDVVMAEEGEPAPAGDHQDHTAPAEAPSDSNGDSSTATTDIVGETSPLVVQLPQDGAHGDGGSRGNTFYGDNVFYYFFRLFELLYSRLCSAKALAADKSRKNWAPSVLDAPKIETEEDRKKKNPYEYLVNCMYSLLDGALDPVKFEDDCRELFGVSSYFLFTMEKLIYQVTKNLSAIMATPRCTKLLAFFKYEQARPNGHSEAIYQSNVLELLGESRAFRFTFDEDEGGAFSIELLDTSQKPMYVDVSRNKEKWAKYVDHFVQSDSSSIDPQRRHVFLTNVRNKNSLPDALEDVVLENNLQCKICLSTYKLFFVENTEDYFYRKGALAKGRAAKRARRSDEEKTKRLNQWLDEHVHPEAEESDVKE